MSKSKECTRDLTVPALTGVPKGTPFDTSKKVPKTGRKGIPKGSDLILGYVSKRIDLYGHF